ncbi:MAG: hypothetical protein R2713_14425 [Ilumatobacteraceae bacterium]
MTPLELLWNGWRASYVTTADERPAGDGSIFSAILASGLPDDHTHIVHRGRSTFVIMNAFPYSVGHQLVLPYREVGDLEALEPDEAAELWATVTGAVRGEGGDVAPGCERRHQPRQACGRQCERTPPRARGATMGGRCQLHDRHRQHAHAARVVAGHGGEAACRLAPA